MIKSESYYRRKELLQANQIPTMSEVREELGNALAPVFFEQCPEALKEQIGLTPPLEGPGDVLWTSPSDLLIGKVVLKPPYTDRHIKALTHQGILDLGVDIERKFFNEMEDEKERALREQERRLLAESERKVTQAVLGARREEQLAFEEKTSGLRQAFERELNEKLSELEERLVSEFQELFESEKEKLEVLWQERLEEASEEIVTNLIKKFVDDLAEKEKEITNSYELQLKQQQIQNNLILLAEQARCRQTLKSLQHNLECKNIANMMYVICIERRKCESERQAITNDCNGKITALNKKLASHEETIEQLEKDKNNAQMKLEIREMVLCEVLKQFQKFINFSLKAYPTQAEFLLDVEKMMAFELTKSLLAVEARHKQECPENISWKAGTSKESSLHTMTAQDHHDCRNQVTPVQSGSEISESELLPAMFYKEGMYIREDFRNMLSQGLTISPESLIWNRDVQHLIEIFKRVSKTSIEKSAESTEPQDGPAADTRSLQSCVHFTNKKPRVSQESDKRMKSILSYNITEEEQIIDKVQYGTEDSLGLLCAKDSLTKHRNSIVSSKDIPDEKKTSVICFEKNEERLVEKKPSQATDEAAEVTEEKKPSVICFEKGNEEEVVEDQRSEEPEMRKSTNITTISSESRLCTARDSITLTRLSMKEDKVERLCHGKLSTCVDCSASTKRNSAGTLRSQGITLQNVIEEASIQVPVDTVFAPAEIQSGLNCSATSGLDFLMQSPEKILNRGNSRSLTMHQDSLELLREQKRSSKISVKCSKEAESLSLVKPKHNDRRLSTVAFNPLPNIYKTAAYNFPDSTWKIYSEPTGSVKTDTISVSEAPPKKEHRAVIVGNKEGLEHLQSEQDFTSNRVNSVLDILKDSPDLIKLFTGCTQ